MNFSHSSRKSSTYHPFVSKSIHRQQMSHSMRQSQSTLEHRQKYPDNWDTSRSYKRYTTQELNTIYDLYFKHGKTERQIAQYLQRGEWAIEVVLMKYRQGKIERNKVSRSAPRAAPAPQTVSVRKPPKFLPSLPTVNQKEKKKERRNPNIKKVVQQNRKFEEKSNVVSTKKGEMENHLAELLGF